jgi:leucyl-tRNA synthetase
VFRRNMRQWMMRITAYADRLLDDLDLLDWTEPIKAMQRNWIGRSTGARFASPATPATSRCSPPGPTRSSAPPSWCWRPSTRWSTRSPTPEARGHRGAGYRRRRRRRRERSTPPGASLGQDRRERQEDRQKTGVFTGSYATNPVNGEQVPVWIADYVLMGYGTGAIMAVPCRRRARLRVRPRLRAADHRDPAAVRMSGSPHATGEPTLDTATWPEAFVGDAPTSAPPTTTLDLNGRARRRGGEALINGWLEAHGRGEATINYKLRDWLFSRQRYWGEPFPIVYDETARTRCPTKLPVELPETDTTQPRTRPRRRD